MEIQSNSVLICSCSNLIPVKQVDKIIDVISQVHIENIRWIHFGDGPLRSQFEQLAREKLPNVQYEFRGIVANDKILDFYADNYVDLFINLSSSEGIPVSIMEALSAGIPVVATDVGGTSEAVNSQNGFLISADFNISDVAQTITDYFMLEPTMQIQFRQNAYNYWKDNFNAVKNYNDFIRLIEK